MKPNVLIFKDQVDIKHLGLQQETMKLEAGHKYIVIMDSPFIIGERTQSPLQPLIDTVFGEHSLRIVSSDEYIIIPQQDLELNRDDIKVKLARRQLFKDIYHIEYQNADVATILEGHHSRYYNVNRIVMTYFILVALLLLFIIIMAYIVKRYI